MEKPEAKSKWDDLIRELGAEVPPEVQERETIVASSPAPAPPSPPCETTSHVAPPKRNATTDWNALNTDLGLPPLPEPEPQPVVAEASVRVEVVRQVTHTESFPEREPEEPRGRRSEQPEDDRQERGRGRGGRGDQRRSGGQRRERQPEQDRSEPRERQDQRDAEQDQEQSEPRREGRTRRGGRGRGGRSRGRDPQQQPEQQQEPVADRGEQVERVERSEEDRGRSRGRGQGSGRTRERGLSRGRERTREREPERAQQFEEDPRFEAEVQEIPAEPLPPREPQKPAAVSLWHKIFGSPAEQTSKMVDEPAEEIGSPSDLRNEPRSAGAGFSDVHVDEQQLEMFDGVEAGSDELEGEGEEGRSERPRARRRRGRGRGRGRKPGERSSEGRTSRDDQSRVERVHPELEDEFSDEELMHDRDAGTSFDDDDDMGDGVASGASISRSTSLARSIPSWEEAITFIVDSNMQNRSQRRPPSRPSGGGSRENGSRGGRGRGRRRS